MILYHGTRVAPDVVMVQGLIPAGSKGADAWRDEWTEKGLAPVVAKYPALAPLLKKAVEVTNSRTPAVFATSIRSRAYQYAVMAAYVNGADTGYVYTLNVNPVSAPVEPDRQDTDAYRILAPVPPQQIKGYAPIPKGDFVRLSARFAAPISDKAGMLQMLLDELNKSGIDPNALISLAARERLL